MKLRKLVLPLLTGLLCLLPPGGNADQTNQKLDELFQTLQTSGDDAELQEVESAIWGIWYESGSDTVDVLMQQAAGRMSNGDLAGAESIYTQVIEELPNFSEGWNRRATVRFYRNDYDGSLDDIEQTLKLEPRHFGAIWGLGMILGSKRDYPRAILAFEKLLEIKPNSPDARPRIEQLKEAMANESV